MNPTAAELAAIRALHAELCATWQSTRIAIPFVSVCRVALGTPTVSDGPVARELGLRTRAACVKACLALVEELDAAKRGPSMSR
jgi:hypothetical protein